MFSARYVAGVAILATTPNASHTGSSCANATRLRRRLANYGKHGSYSHEYSSDQDDRKHFHDISGPCAHEPWDCQGFDSDGDTRRDQQMFNEFFDKLQFSSQEEENLMSNSDSRDFVAKFIDTISSKFPLTTEEDKFIEAVFWEHLFADVLPFLTKKEMENNNELEEIFTRIEPRFKQNFERALKGDPVMQKSLFYACHVSWLDQVDGRFPRRAVTAAFLVECIVKQLLAEFQVEVRSWYESFRRRQQRIKRFIDIEAKEKKLFLLKSATISQTADWLERLIKHISKFGCSEHQAVENLYDCYVVPKEFTPLEEIAKDYGFGGETDVF